MKFNAFDKKIFDALARARTFDTSTVYNLDGELFIVMKNYAFRSTTNFSPYSREISYFKNPIIQKIFMLLSDDSFWFFFNKLKKDRKHKSQFETTLIPSHHFRWKYTNIEMDDPLEIRPKTMLLRLIYVFMGVNPYVDHNEYYGRKKLCKREVLNRAIVEIDQLLMMMQECKHNAMMQADKNEFMFTDLGFGRLLKDLQKLIYTYASLVNGNSPTQKDLLLIWGGTQKAFTNELTKRRKEKSEILRFFNKEVFVKDGQPLIEKEFIDASSAKQWLSSKGINCLSEYPVIQESNDLSIFPFLLVLLKNESNDIRKIKTAYRYNESTERDYVEIYRDLCEKSSFELRPTTTLKEKPSEQMYYMRWVA